MNFRIFLFFAAVAVVPAQTFTVVVNFSSPGGPPSMFAPLVQGTDGNFYGTTGSLFAPGAIIKLTPAGVVTTLHTFASVGENAIIASGGLIQASDGNLYGTTQSDGANDAGTIFKITPGGAFTTLYSFGGDESPDGGEPFGGLVQGSDGNLYGTNTGGGANSYGTIFKITLAGALTTIHSFGSAGTNDGAYPRGPLIQAADGNFYGTTSNNGGGRGTVFKVTPSGTLTTLHVFGKSSGDGAEPYAGLIQASDGNFYGTTMSGGSSGSGTVFKITAGGTLTILHSFSLTEGSNPQAPLIQTTDGNLYGTTTTSGPSEFGTVFEITPAGVLTVLHNFVKTDGTSAQSGLIQASDGNLYGTTSSQGKNGDGTVFKFALAASNLPAPFVPANGIVPLDSSVNVIQPGEWVSIYGTNLANGTFTWGGNFPTFLGGTSVTINGKNAYLSFASPGQINVQSPDDSTTGPVPVVVKTAGGSATSTVTLARFGPSFLLLEGQRVAGIIPRGGGSYDVIGPTGSSLGYPTVAAKAGDTIELFATGLGPTSPPVLAGQAFSGAVSTANPVTVLINNVNVTPSFAGLSGASLYQINLIVPPGLGTGDVSLQATVGGAQTQPGVTISLQ